MPNGIQARESLRAIFDDADLFLYEDGTGRRELTTYLGFGTVLRVEVRGDAISLAGRPEVVRQVGARLGVRGEPGWPTLVLDRSWSILDRIMEVFEVTASDDSFDFGAFCFFGYAATHRAERVPDRHLRAGGLPDISLTICEGHLTLDSSGQASVVVYRSPWWEPTASVEEIVAALAARRVSPARQRGDHPAAPGSNADEMQRQEYLDRVAACKELIRAGDAYQVQLGHAIRVPTATPPDSVYATLARLNPSPYMFLWPIAGTTLVGASPESLLTARGRTVAMRPIAGTCRLTGSAAVDRLAEQRMRDDPKELSEHLMLVDLCRNDLARVAVPGTLEVPEYLVLERYSHVAHLVSEVQIRRRPGLGNFQLLRAVYPAGTMTGAPKLRAMEIIDELEVSSRQAYAGAIGLVGRGGFIDSALCIRALTHQDGAYVARASAGIVFDSDPDAEWLETLAKMAGPLAAVTTDRSNP
jgi:2-amino-4-deoxychorismate synthase